jgi:hypothetical protein
LNCEQPLELRGLGGERNPRSSRLRNPDHLAAQGVKFERRLTAGEQIARAMELAAIIARNAPLGIQVTKEAAAITCIAAIRERVLKSADAREVFSHSSIGARRCFRGGEPEIALSMMGHWLNRLSPAVKFHFGP